jgi:hypothetical protein
MTGVNRTDFNPLELFFVVIVLSFRSPHVWYECALEAC